MLTRFNSAQQILSENAELIARVKLAESIAAQRSTENEALKKENGHLKSELQQKTERVVLLEEELRWMRSQYYGSSTQKTDAAEAHPDQSMLFNEPEVLAAIEQAEEAERKRTTKVAHPGPARSV
jgi:transposase IS166 family protein